MGVFEPPVAAPTRDFLAITPGATKKGEPQTFREWLGAETAKERRGQGVRGERRPARRTLRRRAAVRSDGRLHAGAVDPPGLQVPGR